MDKISQSIRVVSKIVKTPETVEFEGIDDQNLNFYFFRLNNWFFGLHQFWYHVGNVLLHAICSGLFTRIALAIVGLQVRFAALAGALFASHPIHTEAVSEFIIFLKIIYFCPLIILL